MAWNKMKIKSNKIVLEAYRPRCIRIAHLWNTM